MGIMVYSLLWVMQDLYHQPLEQPHVLLQTPGHSCLAAPVNLEGCCAQTSAGSWGLLGFRIYPESPIPLIKEYTLNILKL